MSCQVLVCRMPPKKNVGTLTQYDVLPQGSQQSAIVGWHGMQAQRSSGSRSWVLWAQENDSKKCIFFLPQLNSLSSFQCVMASLTESLYVFWHLIWFKHPTETVGMMLGSLRGMQKAMMRRVHLLPDVYLCCAQLGCCENVLSCALQNKHYTTFYI